MPALPSDHTPSGHTAPSDDTPPEETTLDVRTERVLAVGFSLFLIPLVFSPVLENWEDDPEDGFPLSHYPMFTDDREGDQRGTFLAATDVEGQRRPLSYKLAGTGGFNQVRRQIRKTTREGRADGLGADVAAEIVRENDDEHAGRKRRCRMQIHRSGSQKNASACRSTVERSEVTCHGSRKKSAASESSEQAARPHPVLALRRGMKPLHRRSKFRR